MPDRYRLKKRGTKKYSPNRKQSKLRFIRTKNRVRDPILGHKGIYYTHHVSEGLMTWIDVYFPSKFHKGRYFSAALVTCEMKGLDQDQEAMFRKGDELYPDASLEMKSVAIPITRPGQQKMYSAEFVELNGYAEKREFMDQYEKELHQIPRMIKPEIKIDLDYWSPAIGLHGVVNTPSLTEEVIIEFIEMFQALGEPITEGIVWTGEEVEVVPGRIEERHAQYRSNTIKADLG